MNLYIDIDRKVAVQGKDNNTFRPVPPFTQGDGEPMVIYLLRNWSGTTYEYVPVSGITLQVAIGSKSGSVTQYYTQQFTWTPSSDLGNPYWSATLPMNTNGINALLGSKETASAWLEVKKIENAVALVILSKKVIVEGTVIKPETLAVPANLTPISAEAANAAFLGRHVVGSFDVVNATTGKGFRVSADEDGTAKFDPLQ
jgi:hypothetical protein